MCETLHGMRTILVAVLFLPSVAAAQPFPHDWKSAWPKTGFSKRPVDLSGAVFYRRVGGQPLSFTKKHGLFVDRETGSVWNIFGVATSGPLKGKKLDRMVSGDFFAFAWMAFRPDTRIYKP